MKNKRLSMIYKNGTFIFFLAMFIESIFMNKLNTNIIGIMFLFDSFIFFYWLDKVLDKFSVKIYFRQKLVIFILSFFITIIAMMLKEIGYIVLVIEIILNIIVWFLVIYISNRKELNRK